MVAKTRNVDAGDLAGLKDRHTLRDFNWISIYEDFGSVFRVGEVDSGPADGSSLGKIWGGESGWAWAASAFWSSLVETMERRRRGVKIPGRSFPDRRRVREESKPSPIFWVLLLSQMDKITMKCVVF